MNPYKRKLRLVWYKIFSIVWIDSIVAYIRSVFFHSVYVNVECFSYFKKVCTLSRRCKYLCLEQGPQPFLHFYFSYDVVLLSQKVLFDLYSLSFQHGETDCWPQDCPPVSCADPVISGGCCPTCACDNDDHGDNTSVTQCSRSQGDTWYLNPMSQVSTISQHCTSCQCQVIIFVLKNSVWAIRNLSMLCL